MSKHNAHKFSPEGRDRAVRLLQAHRVDHPPQWLAVASIAPKIGFSPPPY